MDAGPEEVFRDAISRATQIAALATTDEQWDEMWDVLLRLVPLGRKAFDGALGMLAGTYWERSIGCDLLGMLCNPDDQGWSHEAALALSALCEGESDPEVLWSAATAFGYIHDTAGLAVLLRLRDHPDSDIRLAVARAIPACRTFAGIENVELHAMALLELMNDDDPRVRDWATFGLGSQLDIDGPEIRAALYRRVHDDDPDVRSEAISGLARRRDSRVLEYVLAALDGDPVENWAIDAAGYLTDQRLFAALQSLPIPESPYTERHLRDSLRRCDPNQQSQMVDQLVAFFHNLEHSRLPSDVTVAVACDLLEKDLYLSVSRQGQEVLGYCFESFLDQRCTGDSSKAIEAIMTDLEGQMR